MTKLLENIVEKILKNYFDKNQIAEYKSILQKSSVTSKSSNKLPSGSVDNEQLERDFTPFTTLPSYIDLLITYATEKLPKLTLIELLMFMGEDYVVQGQFEIAEQIYLHILSIVKNESEYQNISASALLSLGIVYSQLAQWKKSVTNINQARKLFEKHKNFKGCARCNNILGTVYGDRGDMVKAKKCFQDSLTLLNTRTDIALIGNLELNMGILENMQGNFESAFYYYQRALIKYEQLKDNRRLAELRHNMGMLYSQRGEYELAKIEFDKSIAISLNESYMPKLALSYLGKAFVFAQLNDFPLAIAFADKSLDISLQIKDRLTVADIYKVKGIVEKKKKNYEMSENYLLTSFRINTEVENILNQAESAYELGELYIEMKKTIDAKRYLQIALKKYSKLNAEPVVKKMQQLLAKIR